MCSKCFREVAKKELESQQAVKAVASALAAPQAQAEPQQAAEARPAAEPAPSTEEAGPSSAPEAAGTSDSAPAAAAPQAPEPCPTRCASARERRMVAVVVQLRLLSRPPNSRLYLEGTNYVAQEADLQLLWP